MDLNLWRRQRTNHVYGKFLFLGAEAPRKRALIIFDVLYDQDCVVVDFAQDVVVDFAVVVVFYPDVAVDSVFFLDFAIVDPSDLPSV